jgi:hypothetical protein
VYDPAARAFLPVDGDLGAARAFTTATELANGDVLIVGGYDTRLTVTAGAWLYRASGR